ncbi:MAG: hypothetical protein AABY06_01075 [Nanoarchaeota archaeon]|mgnify:CR=1 FL=1
MILTKNLPEKGISRDYKLSFGNLSNYIEKINEGASSRTKFLARRAFLNRKIPQYGEFFSSQEYLEILSSENQLIILEINKTVDQINKIREQMQTNKDTNYETLSNLRKNLIDLIS